MAGGEDQTEAASSCRSFGLSGRQRGEKGVGYKAQQGTHPGGERRSV